MNAETQVAAAPDMIAATFTPAAKRVAIGSPLYNRILEAYYDEAAMLDELRYNEWIGWLAKDLRYTVPQRLTRLLADHDQSIDRSVMHFDENYQTICARVRRLRGNSAFAEDPPSRTRRLITNIRVELTGTEGEYRVLNYMLLTRSRFELVEREVIIDQSVLGMPNLAIFL